MAIFYSNNQEVDNKNDSEGGALVFTDLMIGVVFLLLILISFLSFSYRSQTQKDTIKIERAEAIIQAHEKQKKQIHLLQEKNKSLVQDLYQAKLKHQNYVKKIQDSRFIPQHLLKQLEIQFKQYKLPITINFSQSILHFQDSILFATNSSELTQEGKKVLNQVGHIFARVLPCYSEALAKTNDNNKKPFTCNNFGYKQIEGVFIEGHTDNVPFDVSTYDNWTLSMSRAKTTYEYLLSVAPQLNQLRNKSQQLLFSLSAYADTRPIAPNDSKENRAKNRRIDIRLISFGYIIKDNE